MPSQAKLVAPKRISELVERFSRQLDAYKSGQYNETQLRREFLDPFFKALGWDIDNEQGYAEAYKDVIHEDAIRMGSATKAPDYVSASVARASFSSRPRNRPLTSSRTSALRINCAVMHGQLNCR